MVARTVENYRRQRFDDELDALWQERGPVAVCANEMTVVADGLWYNPNHFLRLRLFVEALAQKQGFQLVGLLRKSTDTRARRALERIGFREFLYIDEDDEYRDGRFSAEADRLLALVRSHLDILKLDLPYGLPPYTFYDTVLKLTANAQPPLEHEAWRTVLAQTLKYLSIYNRELSKRNVGHVVLSHLWKNEWATLTWLALRQNIATYHLTGNMEAMRVRRLRSHSEYRCPVETIPLEQFEALPSPVRSRISDYGRRMLHQRTAGNTNDLNVRYAHKPDLRVSDRGQARRSLGITGDEKLVVVYAHAWYDFPHIFGMSLFADFKDWFEFTLEFARTKPEVRWILKPHPTEHWYGGYYLANLVDETDPHIHVLDHDVDSQTIVHAADAIVTAHGTVALECVVQGKPVVLADRSHISDWLVGNRATSRDHYRQLLTEVENLPPPSAGQQDRAAACYALTQAQPPAESLALRLTCDSGGSKLFRELIERMLVEQTGEAFANNSLSQFLDQDEFHAYAAYNLIRAAECSDLTECPL